MTRDGGRMAGIVTDRNMLTVDDLIVGIATDVDRLVQPVVGELMFGHHPSPVRAGAQLSSR